MGIIFSASIQAASILKLRGQIQAVDLLNEVLDLLQPAEVLLLLFDIDVLGNEDGEIGVNTPLVEVGLEERLEVLVELREGRAGVHLLG